MIIWEKVVELSEDVDVRVKIGDFGLARSITSSIAGTLNTWQWLAPEVISDDGEYNLSSDVYSFAISFWELLAFSYPFDEYQQHPRYSRVIIDGNGNEIRMINSGLTFFLLFPLSPLLPTLLLLSGPAPFPSVFSSLFYSPPPLFCIVSAPFLYFLLPCFHSLIITVDPSLLPAPFSPFFFRSPHPFFPFFPPFFIPFCFPLPIPHIPHNLRYHLKKMLPEGV